MTTFKIDEDDILSDINAGVGYWMPIIVGPYEVEKLESSIPIFVSTYAPVWSTEPETQLVEDPKQKARERAKTDLKSKRKELFKRR